MSFLPLYVYLIAVSFLVSMAVYFMSEKRYSYLRYFPVFLFLTFSAETIGHYLKIKSQNNVPLYNFFSTFEFFFYLWLLSLILIKPAARTTSRVLAVIYTIVAVLNILFYQGINVFHTITYCIGCLIVVAVCIYYFYELFKMPKAASLARNPAFWICSGLLFFYCCSFPLFGYMNSWFNAPQVVVTNIVKIIQLLNSLLYIMFTIALLCSLNRKYTLSRS